MIRRLTKGDHDVCMKLLKTMPAENLFIIGDIETYGYEQEFQKLWGEFNESGELIAVLLKFEDNYIPFAHGSFNAEGFAAIMSGDSHLMMMSGLKEVTEQVEPYLTRQLTRKKQTHYAKCTSLNPKLRNIDFSIVQQARPDDAQAIVSLIKAIPEFAHSTVTAERQRRGLEDGSTRSYFIRENGKMVSTASTAAENSLSAMVVSVATRENTRKKGYATKCVLKLCSQLLSEGKELCLFYDNPAAGAIYKKIGFEDIGFWMMYTYGASIKAAENAAVIHSETNYGG